MALGLIAHRLTEYHGRTALITCQTLTERLRSLILQDLARGEIDHGALSALIVLNKVHELYRNSIGWDINDFYYEVVDSATAIFLHNKYRFTELNEYFGQGTYGYDYPNTLGYLLYFCDNVCEWSRKTENEFSLFRLVVQEDNVYIDINRAFEDGMRDAIALFDNQLRIYVRFIS